MWSNIRVVTDLSPNWMQASSYIAKFCATAIHYLFYLNPRPTVGWLPLQTGLSYGFLLDRCEEMLSVPEEHYKGHLPFFKSHISTLTVAIVSMDPSPGVMKHLDEKEYMLKSPTSFRYFKSQPDSIQTGMSTYAEVFKQLVTSWSCAMKHTIALGVPSMAIQACNGNIMYLLEWWSLTTGAHHDSTGTYISSILFSNPALTSLVSIAIQRIMGVCNVRSALTIDI